MESKKRSYPFLWSMGWFMGMILLMMAIWALISFSPPHPIFADEPAEPRSDTRLVPAANTQQDEKVSPVPSPLAGRVDEHYWPVVERVRTTLAQGDTSDIASLSTELARVNNAGAIHTAIYFSDSSEPWDERAIQTELEALGIVVEHSNTTLRAIQAWVPARLAEDVARLPGVARVALPSYAHTNVGSVVTEGDSIIGADRARQEFSVDGSGVHVGVISDGVDHRDSVGDDLPATITVHPSLPGSGDEGTAMLEIVHDLAPGAQLSFCGPETSIEMTTCIEWFVAQGADVIVDDLTFPSESYFSDSDIAGIARGAIDSGLTYVTSAGNFGMAHYQGDYVFSAGGYHTFNGNGSDPDQLLDIVVNPGTIQAVLQWSDKPGFSSNDYDLYLYRLDDTSAEVEKSITVQDGDDTPIERIIFTNGGNTEIEMGLVVRKMDGAQDRELELYVFGSGNVTDDDIVVGDSIPGHAAAEGVIAVGAINASDSGHDDIVDYSSRGPSTVYTDFEQQFRWLRNSLDGASIDEVETRVGQLGHFGNPFYGTSAAAPHVAGIVALMLQADDALTPEQVVTALGNTADDLGDVGYDHTSGAGRFNAYEAVSSVAPSQTAPAAPTNLVATKVSDTEVHLAWNDNSDNEQGFKIQRRTEGKIGWVVLGTVAPDSEEYNDTLVTCDTTYEYEVYAYNSEGNSAAATTTTTVACEGPGSPPAAPTDFTATTVSGTEIQLSWTDTSDNESGFKIERSLTGTDGWTLLTTTNPDVTTYTDRSCSCETTCYYRLQAYNDNGSSDYLTANATTDPCTTNPDAGDCNADGKVNAADIPAIVLRFRKDWFADNAGCDANTDSSVDVSDISCTALLIFGRSCASSASTSLPAAQHPRLALPASLQPDEAGNLSVPVRLHSNQHRISSLFFTLAYDASRLSFDPTDSNSDGIPDAVTFLVPDAFDTAVMTGTEQANRLDILIVDTTPPLASVEDGTIVTLTLRDVSGRGETDSIPTDAVRMLPEQDFASGNTQGQRVVVRSVREQTIYLPLVQR